MMKQAALLTLLLTTACAVSVGGELTVGDETSAEEEPGYPEGATHGGDHGPHGCGYQALDVVHSDGTKGQILIPLECDLRPEEAQGSGPVELPVPEGDWVETPESY